MAERASPRGTAESPREPSWLAQLREIVALAQTGLAYTKDPFDAERYRQVLDLAREMAAHLPERAQDATPVLFHMDGGYVTPKLDIRVAVFDQQGRLLLVKEKSDGKWSLPGGWADINQTAAQVAAKEVLEESGLTVDVVRLVALLDRRKHAHPPMLLHVYKAFFVAHVRGGDLHAGLETTDAAFFDRGRLPPLSLPRVTEDQVRLMFEYLDTPSRPAHFD